jgi:integrase
MAYIRKDKGKWRAEVERLGVRKSRSFETKSAATQWAAAEEAELLAVKRGAFPAKTLAETLRRYADEVSPTKRGKRFEQLRIEALIRDFPKLAAKRLTEVTTPDLAAWRDARLKTVSAGSVQRDINLLSNVFTVARDEWRWFGGDSPFRGMRAPGDNPPRDRRPTPSEVRRLCRWLGYRTGRRQATKQAEVALAFLVSLRSGMRASEVLSLSSETLDLDRRVATVRHKTQHLTGRPRQVPLTRQAARLLRPCLPGQVFTVASASLDALFRKATRALLIPDLHFHDARGDALTRLSRKVDVLTLARISGHKDLRVLLEHYYRESAQDIAARLD